jgi:hypothetical protein
VIFWTMQTPVLITHKSTISVNLKVFFLLSIESVK